MNPLLARLSLSTNKNPTDDNVEDDKIFRVVLVGTGPSDQGDTRITKTQRETTDED